MSEPVVEPQTNDVTPTDRPTTSGTELQLKTERRTASNAFKRANRAEQTYMARKKAAAAREGATEAKEHFGNAKTEFVKGVRKSLEVVMALPSVLKVKKDERRKKAELGKMEAADKKRKVWEEKNRELEEAASAEEKKEAEKAAKKAEEEAAKKAEADAA